MAKNNAPAGEDDVLEQISAGLEGTTRGLLGPGASAISHATGAGPELEARAAKYPKTAAVTEGVGEMFRDIASYAVAGPAGYFANGALNLAGKTADEAYQHDPVLSREHVMIGMAREMFGAGLKSIIPVGVEALKPAGKWAMGKAVQAASATVGKRASGYLGGLLEDALNMGIFGAGRARGTAALQSSAAEATSHVDRLLALADRAGPVENPELGRFLEHAYGATSDKAAKKILAQAAKSAYKGTPSAFYDAEQVLQAGIEAAEEAGNGATHNALQKVKDAVKMHNDVQFTKRGVHIDAIRELHETAKSHSQMAEKLANALPPIDYAGAALASAQKGAVGVGIETAAQALPPGAVKMGAELLGLSAAGGAAKPLAKAAVPSVIQGMYSGGKGMGELFDQSTFFAWLGGHLGQQADQAAAAVLGGIPGPAIKHTADDYIEALTSHFHQPEAVRRNLADHVSSLPLPTAAHDASQADAQTLMALGQSVLPERIKQGNRFASPSSRMLNFNESVQVKRKVDALVDPIATLQNPTPEGLAQVMTAYPGLYKQFMVSVAMRGGPNMPSTHPGRQALDKLGVTAEISKLQAITQQVYKMPVQPPPGAQQSGGKTVNNITNNRVTHSQTASEGQQARDLAGE